MPLRPTTNKQPTNRNSNKDGPDELGNPERKMTTTANVRHPHYFTRLLPANQEILIAEFAVGVSTAARPRALPMASSSRATASDSLNPPQRRELRQ